MLFLIFVIIVGHSYIFYHKKFYAYIFLAIINMIIKKSKTIIYYLRIKFEINKKDDISFSEQSNNKKNLFYILYVS